jgi:hypothetical protein
LLLDYLPRPVRTQREYEQVCRQIAKLMSAGPELPQAESELLEILSLLVAQYESTEHSIRDASPSEMLAFLSTSNVDKLAKYFHVSPAVFIAETALPPPVSVRPRTRTGRTSSQCVTGKPPAEQIKEA